MGKYSKIIVQVLILFILCSSIIIAQDYYTSKYLRFQHITVKDGLSQSSVHHILQDKKGYLWFCTEDGLNRYDGYNIKIYKHNPNNLNSLTSNYVFTAYEDNSGFIWFGTDGGLTRFNPINEQFTQFAFNPTDSTGLSGNYVLSIYQSHQKSNVLWVGTNVGLNKLILDNQGFPTSIIHYKYNSKETNCISNNTVSAITGDSSGKLWIATVDGLNRFNPTTEKFKWYKNDPQNPNSLCNNLILDLYLDGSGVLWIGTNNGLDKLLPENMNGDFPAFIHYKNDPKNLNSLSDNQITSIYETKSGILWVGTFNGLNELVTQNADPQKQIFIHFTKQINNPSSLLDRWVHSIYEDNSGILWLGTHSGISILNPKKNKFLLYQHFNNDNNSINSNFISGILVDSEGLLWVGTYDEGINVFDKKREKITYYKNIPGDLNSLSSNKIRSIVEDDLGRVWIGTISGGVDRFDRKSKKFVRFIHYSSDHNSISDNNILFLYKDKKGVIWIATSNGLNKFDNLNNRFMRYENDIRNANSLCNNIVRAICEDNFGYLWIGTDNGLDKFDRGKGQFFHYRNNPRNSNSLINNRIISLFADSENNLWIGTGSGLNKLELNKGLFTRYRLEDGLPNEIIYGILEDSQNNLWLSTNDGLFKFNPQSGLFFNYDTDDGIQSNEFNATSFYKSKTGEMFFGGVNGFNAFFPYKIKASTYVPPVLITSFLKFNKEVPLNKTISETDTLKLSYKDYVFSFEFVSLDFQAPQKNKYAYKMEGIDKEWIYTTAKKRFASYTTLPSGDYVFRVKGSNSDGIWNKSETSIIIFISPPFWQTWWFRYLSIAILLTLLIFIYKYRVNKIEEKKRLLEIQVKEKTEAAHKIQEALSEVEKLKNQLQAENIYLQDEIKLTHNFENIISTSESFKKLLYKVEQVSGTDSTVLILGESGTGKELLARAIHSLSTRKNKPLIKVNCATLPANLIESELFGHEKGAFTGAFIKKIGRFEVANSGTIFLDEIGDLPLELQTKLLRVLQENEFERLGGTTPIQVDVRVIAATNRDLEEALNQGNFREDLYYRLNVFPIKVPPLRERKEDIPVLVNHFINKHSKKVGKRIETISPRNMSKLIEYNWPGNVRELENVIERAIIISQTKELSLDDSFIKTDNKKRFNGYHSLEEIERKYIIEVLESTKWRVSGPNGAAKILGLIPSTLEYRMKKLGIQRK